MRALILSDIHANLEAFRAVIDDANNRGGFDVLWCLGDLVGYGPDPVACLKLVQSHSFLAVAGNHDQATTIERHRVAYDIESTQDKMREPQFPEYLIERLKLGI